MSDNSNTTQVENVPAVDPNTDDLDQFSLLLSGKAVQKEEEEKTEAVTEDGKDADDVESVEIEKEIEQEEEAKTSEEASEEKAEEEKAKPKSKSRFQERIDQLTAQNKETQRQLSEALAAIKNEVKDGEVKTKEAPKPVTQETRSPPKPDEVTSDGEEKYPLGEFDPLYIRDLTRFTIQQETEAQRLRDTEESNARQMEEARTAIINEWDVKLDKAQESVPDIREKIKNLQGAFSNIEPNYGEYLATTIMSLDKGTDVMNYLSENLEEARKIVASGPTKATIALGRLEARFYTTNDNNETSEETEEAKPRVSTAPAPPPVTTRGSGTKTSIAGDTDDLDAFEKVFYQKKR